MYYYYIMCVACAHTALASYSGYWLHTTINHSPARILWLTVTSYTLQLLVTLYSY